MKTLINSILFGALLFALACNNPRREADSKEIAKETNDELIEDNETQKSADLVVELVSLNQDELELAELAAEKSTSPDVRSVATELVKEHNKMIQELTAMAAAKGISIPMEPSEKGMDKVQELRQEQGEDFNEKIVDELEAAHRKTVDKLEKLADAEDPELQTWASNNISKVQAHLDVLKETEDDATKTDRARDDREPDNETGVQDEVNN